MWIDKLNVGDNVVISKTSTLTSAAIDSRDELGSGFLIMPVQQIISGFVMVNGSPYSKANQRLQGRKTAYQYLLELPKQD